MIGVEFRDGEMEEFWKRGIKAISGGNSTPLSGPPKVRVKEWLAPEFASQSSCEQSDLLVSVYGSYPHLRIL
jgi:hypothetical protein